MKPTLKNKLKTVIPKWAKGHSGKWIIRRPKIMPIEYSCGKCGGINELTIPVKNGEFRTPCMYCGTINKMYRNLKEHSIF